LRSSPVTSLLQLVTDDELMHSYTDWNANLLVVLGTIVSVGICVLLHYEGLSLLSRWQQQSHEQHRRRKVLYGIFGVLFLHVLEIWIFGAASWILLSVETTGGVAGTHQPGILDAVYLAAMTYSTVGFGDLAPVGPIRFMFGTMALTGFVLITWSASFTFLEMERYWRR
jgi:hypothetical protein